MADVEWTQPLGAPGRVEVRELLNPNVWSRYFAASPEAELDLGRSEVAGRPLDLRARKGKRWICAGERVVAELDVSGPPDFSGGWDKQVTLLGVPGRATLQVDETRPSRVRGALRYLRIDVDDRQWTWHFEGGRTAGERLVLLAGALPGTGPALVTTHPSAHGRSMGNPRGGATADLRVVTWTAAASALDVLVAELCATSVLHPMVDYRPSRIAGGFSELLGYLPRADANVE